MQPHKRHLPVAMKPHKLYDPYVNVVATKISGIQYEIWHNSACTNDTNKIQFFVPFFAPFTAKLAANLEKLICAAAANRKQCERALGTIQWSMDRIDAEDILFDTYYRGLDCFHRLIFAAGESERILCPNLRTLFFPNAHEEIVCAKIFLDFTDTKTQHTFVSTKENSFAFNYKSLF